MLLVLTLKLLVQALAASPSKGWSADYRHKPQHFSGLAQQPQAFALQYRLSTATYPQLGEKVMQVPFDGGLRQVHRLGNVAIRQSSGDKAQNFPLSMANILIFIENF